MDGQTEFSSLDRVCISCIAVKHNMTLWSIKYRIVHIQPNVFE